MKDYIAQVRTMASGLCSGSEAMRAVMLDMIRDNVPEAEAESAIISILWDVFGCDDPMPCLNDFRELCIKKAGCEPVRTPETSPELSHLPTTDEIARSIRADSKGE